MAQGFDMNKLLQQAQQMQAQMAQAQEQLANEVVEASAGGGLVTVRATGAGEIREIKIDPRAIDPDDPELLEDTVLAAVNEALRSAQALAQAKLGSKKAECTFSLTVPYSTCMGMQFNISVASKVGGIPDLLTREDNAILVEPNNPTALGSAIQDVLKGQRKDQKSKSLVKAISWSENARQLYGVLEESLAGSNDKPSS